ncbi:MAG: polysaccharide pyruvyl transferase CsaB [Oscillospiraceae bacterium]|nr:polysaccharide pyruvyl transferase CsaB [Oscillospiraceae bacterium]
MKKDRRGVLICGAYGHGNIGDDAILEAIMRQMREIEPDMPVWALSRAPGETRERLGIGAVHPFNVFGFLRVMRKAKIYLSGGGSLIQDATSRRSLWYYLTSIKLAKKCGCLVAMYGCGIGPVLREGGRRRTRRILNKYVDVITLREDSSLDELKQLGVDGPEIILASDPALSLPSAPEEEVTAVMQAHGMDPNGRYICFALRDWKGFSEKAAVFAAAADRAYEKHGFTPVFIAINHRSDGDAADAVTSMLTAPFHAIREPLTSGLAIGIMSRMAVVVAMRLHGLIFAAGRGVPLIGVDYDPKVTAFLRYAGHEMYAPLQTVDEAVLNDYIARAAEQGGSKELEENTRRLARLGRRNVEAVRKLYFSAPCQAPRQPDFRRIAIFQSDLRVGGIQKSLVNILSGIDYSRCAVDLYLFERGRFFEFQEHPNLRVRYLKPYPYVNRIVYFRLLRKLMKPPGGGQVYDVAVDFNSYRNECAIGALGVAAKKRVMWIHNDIELKLRNERRYRILWHFFKKKLPLYDEFCAVSPGIIDGFRRASGVTDKPVTAIPNPINTEEILIKAGEPADFPVQPDPGHYNLCTVGRICHQKGFDILIDRLARVVPERPDLRLYLLGDGPDREKLQKQIERLKLGKVVTLLGYRANPFPYLRLMDGFALTSRYEGQGIVIWEAKSLGLELFIDKHLEKYNPGVEGVDDMVKALIAAKKREKVYDALKDYNESIRNDLFRVLELNQSP